MSSIKLSAMRDRKPVKVNINGEDLCLTRIGNEVFAINDTCTHSEASLSEGDVTDFKIECWLHGAEFDLRTGEALTLPANIAVKTYPVSIVDDVVEVHFTDK
ncbi:non-heme iron oxygenase ferredoxin subunit [Candidatus Planktophila limnetica]|nr:non-heme iron oxygenase ferredoxin subunit [Candidatus Planktophila limnetica]